MEQLSGRAPQVAREVTGNVIWLVYPARDPKRPSTDAIASLKQSLADLALKLEHSKKLRADIATAVRSRRYEQYKGSVTAGVCAVERRLAAAQGVHLTSLLRFVHAIAAVRVNDMATESAQGCRFDPLAASIREFQASLRHARQLSRDMQVQAECRDWAAVRGRHESIRDCVPEPRMSMTPPR